MNVLIPVAVCFGCAIILKIMDNSDRNQSAQRAGSKYRQWRRFLYAVEVAAGIVAVWQVNGL